MIKLNVLIWREIDASILKLNVSNLMLLTQKFDLKNWKLFDQKKKRKKKAEFLSIKIINDDFEVDVFCNGCLSPFRGQT